MFDHLFHYPRVLARHQNAPMLIEREQFLEHCAAQGMARTTLTSLATELSVVAQRLEISGNGVPIGHQQIMACGPQKPSHAPAAARTYS